MIQLTQGNSVRNNHISEPQRVLNTSVVSFEHKFLHCSQTIDFFTSYRKEEIWICCSQLYLISYLWDHLFKKLHCLEQVWSNRFQLFHQNFQVIKILWHCSEKNETECSLYQNRKRKKQKKQIYLGRKHQCSSGLRKPQLKNYTGCTKQTSVSCIWYYKLCPFCLTHLYSPF